MRSYHKAQRQQQSNLLRLKTNPSAAVHQLHLEMQTHHRALQAAFQQTVLTPPKKIQQKMHKQIYIPKEEEKQNNSKKRKRKKNNSQKNLPETNIQKKTKPLSEDTISPWLVKTINIIIVLTTKATTQTSNTEHVCEITKHKETDIPSRG